MSSKAKLVLMGFSILALSGTSTVRADRYAVTLNGNDIVAVSPVDTTLGNAYVSAVMIPEVLKEKKLLAAILELTVDVSACEVDGYLNDTPLLEVYALTGTMESGVDPEKFRTPSPMRRNVRIGSNRRVRIDITQAVRRFVSDPLSNHGLVIGSLTARREGLFTIVPVDGALGKITFYYVSAPSKAVNRN